MQPHIKLILAGFIYCSGLLQRQHVRKTPQAYELYRNRAIKPGNMEAIAFRHQYGNRVPIKLLGCWDTVGALGVPSLMPVISDRLNAPYKFYDTNLNRQIEHALHAVAIDERRKMFDVTPMTLSDGATTTLAQMWFPGTHSCVGGGDLKTSGLAAAALLWMLEGIDKLQLGLEFFDHPETIADGGIKPDYTATFTPEIGGVVALGGIADRCLQSAEDSSNPSAAQAFFDQHIHVSAKRRWALTHSPLYRSKNLKPYQQCFDAFQEY